MANIQARKNKDGVITSYTIRVYGGRDKYGKQLKSHTMTYKPQKGMTAREIKKELDRVAMDFEQKISTGYTLDNKQTFEQYAEYVMQCKEREGLKRNTLDNYNRLLKRINAGIGHIRLVDLKPQHLNMFYDQLKNLGIDSDNMHLRENIDLKAYIKSKGFTIKRFIEVSGVKDSTLHYVTNHKNVKTSTAKKICDTLSVSLDRFFEYDTDNTVSPLSNNTIMTYHCVISTILAQAENEMLIPFSPEKKVNKNTRKSNKKEEIKDVECYEPAVINEIQRCIKQEPLKWQTITHLLLVTGCRRGEIAGLKWSAIDFDKKTMRIDNVINYSTEIGIYQGLPKTKSSIRTLYLPDETVAVLKNYRKEWEQIRRSYGSLWNSFLSIKDNDGAEHSEKADFLFFQEKIGNIGYPIHPVTITGYYTDFSKRYNLPHIHPHAFRHTLASTLCVNGIDIVTISKWLGHEDVSTTLNVYEHALEKGKREVVECVSNVMLK